MPISRARYAGGRDPRVGVRGDCGLLDRIGFCGEENVRAGRGRTGVTTVKSVVELELDEEDITEAFRLRSASVGGCASDGKTSVDGAETWIFSMRAAEGAVRVAEEGEESCEDC